MEFWSQHHSKAAEDHIVRGHSANSSGTDCQLKKKKNCSSNTRANRCALCVSNDIAYILRYEMKGRSNNFTVEGPQRYPPILYMNQETPVCVNF
mmetsp:Transcript_12345/g.17600  ORF Transcript_12345/g.17600 Transcript_12345/m.17600 type:complete len:94 (-) Transcript_12345:6-287(-)